LKGSNIFLTIKHTKLLTRPFTGDKLTSTMDNIQQLLDCGRLLHEHRLVIGSGGNISARQGADVTIKKKDVDMSRAVKEDYVTISLDAGRTSENTSLSSETPLHLACYASGRNISSVIHVHSPYMTAVAARTDILESPSYEFDCLVSHPAPVIPYLEPGSLELGEAVADKLASGANAVLMRRHGAVAAGKTIEEAYLRILALERACITFLHIQ
jgi:L-fuculose-phosphate aldolase